MIIPLAEAPSRPHDTERRRAPRLVPTSGVLYADAVTHEGHTFRFRVGDVSSHGVRLLGDTPFEVGDRFRVGLHLDPSMLPFRTSAVVSRCGPCEVVARFTT